MVGGIWLGRFGGVETRIRRFLIVVSYGDIRIHELAKTEQSEIKARFSNGPFQFLPFLWLLVFDTIGFGIGAKLVRVSSPVL